MIVVPPSGALKVEPGLLIQLVVGLAGVESETPAGSGSVKAKTEAPVPWAVLSIVNVSRLLLPGPIAEGAKNLLKEGAWLLVLRMQLVGR